MFELREEGTIFGEVGRFIDQETYNLLLKPDRKYFKRVTKKYWRNSMNISDDFTIRSSSPTMETIQG